ncbi:MAG: ABC transporter permease [Clostridiales Family XIII bacterium]|nr:ABC transporter permease [Clostridiales Family XIII bacterium]
MGLLINILKDHIKWRHQIFKLAKSDIIKTYSGSALGWAWAVIKPTILILIFWFVFEIGLRVQNGAEGIPFILWLISGLVPWFFMDEMITGGTMAYLVYSYLVTKMKFPVSTISTFIGVSKLIVNLFLMAIVVVIFCLYGRFPDIYYLQLPFYILLMFLFFVNWALFAAMLSAISKDFMNVVASLVTAVFWMSGVMFNVRGIENPVIKTLLKFDPVTFLAEGFRDVFIYKVWFWDKPYDCAAFAVMLLLMIILALWSYKKLNKEIPDVL